MKADFNDCLQFCCRSPDSCDRVCRNNPDFPNRVREVAGFDFDNVPRSFVLAAPKSPSCVPIIYHRTSRDVPFARNAVALPLHAMFNAIGKPAFIDRAELCRTFALATECDLLLSGTAKDLPLEKWWGFGESARRDLIRAMKHLGVGLVTTPNYSLFIDRPRWDDLHSMKRIALINAEFMSEGLPCALHTNGRTETDFLRWTDFISSRPEVTHVAYEFVTGTAWSGRRKQHAEWLVRLGQDVGRSLHLVIRGGADLLPSFAKTFASITYLDTSVFMKTMKRQKAILSQAGKLCWVRSPMPKGHPVDPLLATNDRVVTEWVNNLIAGA